MTTPLISVIIPCYNAAATIGTCLEAIYASQDTEFEVIVVDDCSTDGSADRIRKFPCRLETLPANSGPSVARNRGAALASGEILFFLDADCVVASETIEIVRRTAARNQGCLVGGSYTPVAHDDIFFSTFQSLFINYFELKTEEPDYIASHSMIIRRRDFERSGGFRINPLTLSAGIEDVEFSHRVRSMGMRLVMEPGLLVGHIFRFSLSRSLRNAFRKSKYWSIYSLSRQDVFGNSGTASRELKMNVMISAVLLPLLPALFFTENALLAGCISLLLAVSIASNSGLFRTFARHKGWLFAVKAAAYYTTLYAGAVAAGGAAAVLSYYAGKGRKAWS